MSEKKFEPIWVYNEKGAHLCKSEEDLKAQKPYHDSPEKVEKKEEPKKKVSKKKVSKKESE